MANEESNFGNLTPRARQILLLAKQEADRSITTASGPSIFCSAFSH